MSDQLIHALVAGDTVRMFAISAPELVKKAQAMHNLSRVATAALGRQLLMTAMMASDLKNEGDKVSTIIRGDGPADRMLCTGWEQDGMVAVKGYTENPLTELPPRADGKLDVGGYVGQGQLTVVRDLPVGDPYVGVCNLISGEIAMDFAQYFTVSEQQPSLVYLGVRLNVETKEVISAGGMMLQPLPDCPDEIIDAITARADSISTLSRRLADGQSLVEACFDLLEGIDAHITERKEPAYVCDCSRKRIERALISVGKDELTDMMERDGGAEVKCHFCNTAYRFTKDDLNSLIQAAAENGKE